jgi:hypothetical protein
MSDSNEALPDVFRVKDCSSGATRLTYEQRLELAACYAEYCGLDPQDKGDWRSEMVGAKKFIRELMAIWKKREKLCHDERPG